MAEITDIKNRLPHEFVDNFNVKLVPWKKYILQKKYSQLICSHIQAVWNA